jgi:putative hemolysin
MLATLNSMYRLRSHKLMGFRPKIQIENQYGNFCLKTASNTAELKAALELRYQVLHRELLGAKSKTGLAMDSYDASSDHLLVIDSKRDVVVGALRLSSSQFMENFSLSEEFILTRIISKPGIKVELGRVSVLAGYRQGLVSSLLWRGVRDYMIQAKARWLISCVGIKTDQPRSAALLYNHLLNQGHMSSEFFAPPTLAFTMTNLNFWMPRIASEGSIAPLAEVESLLSPDLLLALNQGAFLGGEPAFHREHQSLDFLMIIDREKAQSLKQAV